VGSGDGRQQLQRRSARWVLLASVVLDVDRWSSASAVVVRGEAATASAGLPSVSLRASLEHMTLQKLVQIW
jgi:hypothetical protein